MAGPAKMLVSSIGTVHTASDMAMNAAKRRGKFPVTSNTPGIPLMINDKHLALGAMVFLGIHASASWADPGFMARARVISATPVYQTVSTPRQECWNESAAQPPRGGNTAGAVIGAITGGLLGATVGKGNGKVAAGAVGAATGAVVGDRWNNGGGPQEVQRCRTVEDTQQQMIGYDVAYQYQGRQFATRLPYAPGPWLLLRVNLQVAPPQPGMGPGPREEDDRGDDGE